MNPPRWVVFDYGEVLCERTTALAALARRLGAGQKEFEARYWARRDDYDLGQSDREYWGAIGADLGVEVSERDVAALTALDTEGWSRLNPDSLELVDTLARQGFSLALLSNASRSFGRAAERREWTTHFHTLVFSGDVGMMKPDPAIYRLLLDKIGAAPADCFFFDDRQSNVDGAIRVGMRARRWRDASEARHVLLDG